MNNKNIESIVDSLFSIPPLFKKKIFRPDKYDEDNDLSPSHLQIMFLLDDIKSGSISEIGKALNISKPNMTPLIKTLMGKNLIKKVRSKEDKRYVNIELSPWGKDFLDEHKLLVTSTITVKLSKLDRSDLQKLSNSLRDLKEVISKLD